MGEGHGQIKQSLPLNASISVSAIGLRFNLIPRVFHRKTSNQYAGHGFNSYWVNSNIHQIRNDKAYCGSECFFVALYMEACYLMVSVLISGLTGPGLSPGWEHPVVFLNKTLHSHSASLHPGT